MDAFLKAWETDKPEGTVTFIGYSNGANFILGLLEKNPKIADEIILLKPTNLGFTFNEESNVRIIVTAGARDTLSIPGETMKLVKQLETVFPNVVFKLFDHGHEFPDSEIEAVKVMLNK